MITSESNAGLAKGVHPFGKVSNVAKKKYRGMMLSTMSIDKGLKKGNETILVALVELKPNSCWKLSLNPIVTSVEQISFVTVACNCLVQKFYIGGNFV